MSKNIFKKAKEKKNPKPFLGIISLRKWRMYMVHTKGVKK